MRIPGENLQGVSIVASHPSSGVRPEIKRDRSLDSMILVPYL
jgi:hypothetical protein